MNNAFLESNIELKVKDLQKEHNIVLKKSLRIIMKL